MIASVVYTARKGSVVILMNKQNETSLKSQLKDYLALRGIYSWPVTQGLGSHRGAPDRVMHFQGRVHFLEIKLPTGKMSEYQIAFQEQCRQDGIPYHVVHSLEELIEVTGGIHE